MSLQGSATAAFTMLGGRALERDPDMSLLASFAPGPLAIEDRLREVDDVTADMFDARFDVVFQRRESKLFD
jgi:hypothetical protein